MRITRQYCTEPLALHRTVTLAENARRHIAAVLRHEVGDAIILFNDDGHDYLGKITDLQKKSLQVTIEQQLEKNTEPFLKIHLGQAISRSEKMDWIIQKAIELGVSKITPLITQHCSIKYSPPQFEKKLLHWQGVIISACEQSGRNILPVLHQPEPLVNWLVKPHQTGLVFHPDGQSLPSLSLHPSQVSLLIGPEGGFSDLEIADAKRQAFQAITLGPRILRMETAALAAITAVQLSWGDFSRGS